MPEPTRVLIVDDDEQIRSGLRLMLATQPDLVVVGEAADGAQAVADTARLHPDVVLMDIRMPGMDGLEATRLIAAGPGEEGADGEETDGTRVIILTTFEQDEYVYEALRMGASGFLLKRTTPEALIEAIRVVVSGDALLYPPMTRRLITHFAPPEPDGTASLDLDRLTERERDVLVEMARGRSNSEIAERLFVGEQTVKTHIRHIFTKLGFRDRAQAVVFAYENGLVRAGESRDS
jgi:DNA-binding NarL/FixJ family response regulator